MPENFKSAFYNLHGFSFVVTWQMKKDKLTCEILSKIEAQRLCAELKRRFKAECFKINCTSGEVIEKIA